MSTLEHRKTQIGRDATWLRPDWPELVEAFQSLGEVTLRTSNQAVTHIKRGRFEDVSFEGPVGLVLGADIDLRLFTHHWKWAVAVHQPKRKEAAEHGVDVYDRFGRTMLELRLGEDSDAGALAALVDELRARETPEVDLEPVPDEPAMTVEDVDQVTRELFAEGWRALGDTHEFFGLLREHGLERHVALELAPDGFAQKLARSAHTPLFEAAQEREAPIMIFASSGGCVQIHTGPVEIDMRVDTIYSLVGPNFRMEIDLEQLGEAWVVKKPTVDGIVTAVEFFDVDHTLAFQVFGERKPGKPELDVWREIVAEVSQHR
jgi:putative hemin transport protein